MSYQVLARKLRPATFEALVGQDHVVRALRHALDADRLDAQRAQAQGGCEFTRAAGRRGGDDRLTRLSPASRGAATSSQ